MTIIVIGNLQNHFEVKFNFSCSLFTHERKDYLVPSSRIPMLPGDISTLFVHNYVFSTLKHCQPFTPVEDTVSDMISKGVSERRK